MTKKTNNIVTRLTSPNPGGQGYRVMLERTEGIRFETQMERTFVFGDIINRLGELEDEHEDMLLKNKKKGLR